MEQYVIGIDVGGTNVKLGIVSAGKAISRASFSTQEFIETPQALIEAIVKAVQSHLRGRNVDPKRVAGVGIGLPGLVDVERGLVRLLPNIPGWRDVPLKKIMEKKLGFRVQLENDVNMITLGEWQYGAGRGFKDLICMTLGTGVGAGLVLNNAIYRGPGFAAGEIGHVPLSEHGPDCGCGGHGCFERYVGNKTLQKKAAKMFKDKDITLEDVYRRALDGKHRALKFWEETGEAVGHGLIGPINMLNPEAVIIGGGVARSFEFIAPAIRRVITDRAMKTQAAMVRLIKARLDDDAGLIGAKVLVQNEER
ncbi:MAG: ROK family protein [Candidatus Omnitrophica bacterium]|nr:ROK family protein [Candidatus Omnitrophota bacterium]